MLEIVHHVHTWDMGASVLVAFLVTITAIATFLAMGALILLITRSKVICEWIVDLLFPLGEEK